MVERGTAHVELVEAVERVLVRVHVERVDGEVVRRQIERLEDLREGEVLAVAVDDDVLRGQRRMSRTGGRQGCASS